MNELGSGINHLGFTFIRFRAYIRGVDLEIEMNEVKFRTK